jgi:hypothetical protein
MEVVIDLPMNNAHCFFPRNARDETTQIMRDAPNRVVEEIWEKRAILDDSALRSSAAPETDSPVPTTRGERAMNDGLLILVGYIAGQFHCIPPIKFLADTSVSAERLRRYDNRRASGRISVGIG